MERFFWLGVIIQPTYGAHARYVSALEMKQINNSEESKDCEQKQRKMEALLEVWEEEARAAAALETGMKKRIAIQMEFISYQ